MSPYMGNPKYTSVKGILKVELTRLHSSRMRTARVLTVSPSMLCTGGSVCSQEVCVPGPGLGGVSGPGGCTWYWGCVCSWGCTWSRGGVPGLGGCIWSRGRCTWSGGYTLSRGGVPGWGVCSWGGVYLVMGGCQILPPCEQNDKQVQKYYLAPNFACGR